MVSLHRIFENNQQGGTKGSCTYMSPDHFLTRHSLEGALDAISSPDLAVRGNHLVQRIWVRNASGNIFPNVAFIYQRSGGSDVSYDFGSGVFEL